QILGRLGGVFRGTIIQFNAADGFFVADAFWLPPDGDPIGPMALEVKLQSEPGGATRLRVTQTGFEESDRWRRYYEVIGLGWTRALASLKSLLEQEAGPQGPALRRYADPAFTSLVGRVLWDPALATREIRGVVHAA